MPGKAAYLAFEDDQELEYEFYLAERLGRTVAELRAGMGNDEFVLWTRFHLRKQQRDELSQKLAGG